MNTPNKYPRTYHWITSPGVGSDDKILRDTSAFLNVPLVITEKLDGGNCSLHGGKVYARSTGLPTICPSFDYIKATHAWKSLSWGNRISAYGENMYALHSIPYDELDDFYYVFGVKELMADCEEIHERLSEYCLEQNLPITDLDDSEGHPELNIWYSWEDLQLFCLEYDLKHVPTVAEYIVFKTEKELSNFLAAEIKKQSHFGQTREGFVIRNADKFKDADFASNVCKYVRENHVQTSTHWSKTWVPNKLRIP